MNELVKLLVKNKELLARIDVFLYLLEIHKIDEPLSVLTPTKIDAIKMELEEIHKEINTLLNSAICK